MSLRRTVVLSILVLAGTTPAAAQNVLRTPERTVEVIGLRRWSLEMVQDSLARYAPGDSLHHGACALTLRYKLGFADASATFFTDVTPDDTVEYVVIAVVEPQDSARVRHKPAPLDTTNERAEWRELITIIEERPMAFQWSLPRYLTSARSGFADPLPAHVRSDSAAVRGVWRFLDARRTAADRDTALAVLAHDPNVVNRMAAAAILSNFGASDTTWHALVEAMTEADGAAASVAASVLTSIARSEPRPVDWMPAVPLIHAMLDGTGLFRLPALLEVLPAGGLDPRWAKPFLAGGGEMVLAYLAAEREGHRSSAHRFLTAVSGVDYGTDVSRWRAWIDGL